MVQKLYILYRIDQRTIKKKIRIISTLSKNVVSKFVHFESNHPLSKIFLLPKQVQKCGRYVLELGESLRLVRFILFHSTF